MTAQMAALIHVKCMVNITDSRNKCSRCLKLYVKINFLAAAIFRIGFSQTFHLSHRNFLISPLIKMQHGIHQRAGGYT